MLSLSMGEKLIGDEEQALPVATWWVPREEDELIPLSCLLLG